MCIFQHTMDDTTEGTRVSWDIARKYQCTTPSFSLTHPAARLPGDSLVDLGFFGIIMECLLLGIYV